MGFDNPIRSPEGAPCRELEHKLQNVLMFSRATFLDRAQSSNERSCRALSVVEGLQRITPIAYQSQPSPNMCRFRVATFVYGVVIKYPS
jgi:hypothetical protein